MKKVTAFVGSAHRQNTHKAIAQFLENLKALGGVECEIATLSDYTLGVCRGCRLCFEKGEELCPLKDDRDVLMDKIAASDGVIFASPNYMFQVSGLMKVFLDRFGYLGHRPRYFGKTFTSIITQGIGGGEKLVDYLDFTAKSLGFNTVKGSSITILDPKYQRKSDRVLAAHSRRFHTGLNKPGFPTPSLFRLMIFRMSRTSIRQMLDDKNRDYVYYAQKGWFESDFFYPARLGFFRKAAGRLFDASAAVIRGLIS